MGSIALLILVIMAFGVMFRIIHLNKIFWFIVLVAILPIVLGVAKGTFFSVFSRESSWITWVIGIVFILVGIRIVRYKLGHGRH